jgi:hypothetical protein
VNSNESGRGDSNCHLRGFGIIMREDKGGQRVQTRLYRLLIPAVQLLASDGQGVCASPTAAQPSVPKGQLSTIHTSLLLTAAQSPIPRDTSSSAYVFRCLVPTSVSFTNDGAQYLPPNAMNSYLCNPTPLQHFNRRIDAVAMVSPSIRTLVLDA